MRLFACLMLVSTLSSASAEDSRSWATSWTASVQGPYPVGNPSAQPDQRFAFGSPEIGAKDQTLASMQRLADLLARENAQLWINHDKAQRDTLKMAPDFYD